MRAASPPEGLHHPEGLRGTRQPSSMAEVLGQRTLVGFGVVLVWLLLFHLLVNIWLLCVFTSLLVVLGGWLGSQALLESSSVVHLERFISLDQVPPSVEDEQRLNQEIHNTVRKIIRDFVSSWFCTVSSERAFEQEVQEAMISMAMELKKRATLVDSKELTKRVLDLLGCHLQDFTRAQEMRSQQQTAPAAKGASDGRQLWQAYSSVARPHPAVCSEAVQLNHTRAAVHVMLHVLVPSAHLETRSGRLVVGELITCNVLLPLISKLADPDWLNCLVVDVFSKSRKPEEPIMTERPSPVAPLASPPAQPEPVPPAETEPAPWGPAVPALSARAVTFTGPDPPEPPAHDVMDSEEGVCPQNHAEEEQPTRYLLRPFMSGSKSNPFYQENDLDLDSPLADCKQRFIDSLVTLKREDGLHERLNGTHLEGIGSSSLDSCCPKVQLSSQPAGTLQGCQLPAGGTAESARGLQNLDWEGAPPAVNPAKELLLGVEQSGLGSPGELGDDCLLQGPCPLPSFIFEPLSSPDGPAVIQNLRITGTITAQEHRGTGSHPYTLYTIKYETAMGCENPGSVQPACEDADLLVGYDNPSSVQQVAYHMVNRRYSEFLNLQTRLEEKPDLRKLIKGVKGPKKVFPDMPFGNMDSDRIEARKGLLEAFLKQLCTIAEVTSSEEMQEFLALNTDARIAFVKKPFIVSRIDKMVVTAIVDTLKTAFPRSEPQSPIEENEGEVDGGKVFSDKRSRSRLKFSNRNIPFMNCSDVRPPVLFSQEHNTTVFSGMSLGDLEAFILEQEELRSRGEPEMEDSPVAQRGLGLVDRRKLGQEPACETPLAEVLLNILCLLMKEQWSWLCTENIQRTIRLLFGTLINRWMDVSVANLTCTRYWVVYLQVIQEAVWPGGSLPRSPRNERSEQQKNSSKQQALHCLMRLLPDLVSDMLGSDKYRLSWQTLLDSFQDPHINRHLVYCILDLLLDFLVPEIPEEDFQRSLLQTLSRNPEKLLV